MRDTPDWKTYEDLTYGIIDDIKASLGFTHVERDATVAGKRSGRDRINVEVVAYRENGNFVLIEVKNRNRPMEGEAMGGFVYRVQDADAEGGIVVSRSGLQKGAEQIAEAEKIDQLEIEEGSSLDSYVARFLERIFVKETEVARISLTERTTVEIRDESGNIVERRESGGLD
ncbi:restriction endonuclease [Maricaulis sp.]|uniref:restriction endonuclease n=1 Tax=Maricaulis sp. TaxID=1486257 RepID=UPI001B18FB74|nr:restriction endonuclease [Maricaulis sp.]MBO6766051.1 restriction endonuclease [Maricaulis sp.]